MEDCLKDWAKTENLKQVYSMCKYEKREQSNYISLSARNIASNDSPNRKEGQIKLEYKAEIIRMGHCDSYFSLKMPCIFLNNWPLLLSVSVFRKYFCDI